MRSSRGFSVTGDYRPSTASSNYLLNSSYYKRKFPSKNNIYQISKQREPIWRFAKKPPFCRAKPSPNRTKALLLSIHPALFKKARQKKRITKPPIHATKQILPTSSSRKHAPLKQHKPLLRS
jgi:hypothetical protein